jgi:hypothetical protein
MNDHAGGSSRVCVMRADGEYKLISRESVPSGRCLFKIDGELTDAPTRYSVQVDRTLHVDLPAGCGLEDIMDHFYWCFMNHSCEPNAVIRGRQLVALKSIEPYQEIRFHYNTTEYELAEPFVCHCGSNRCEGQIRGFRFLSRSKRERLRPWLANHLLSVLNDDALASTAIVKAPL